MNFFDDFIISKKVTVRDIGPVRHIGPPGYMLKIITTKTENRV